MRRIVLTTLAALALGAGGAAAHPRLLAANPAIGARVAAPSAVRLSFSEPLIDRFSTIALADAAGHSAPLGHSALSPDHKQLIAPVKARLRPGAYRVNWRAVSIDTHRVQGSYVFLVNR